MPNVSQISEPIPIYPYHVLVTTNFRLPKDVDRCGLEVTIDPKKALIKQFMLLPTETPF